MSIPEDDPTPPPSCPECHQADRTMDATDLERATFHKPYWCLRCNVPFTGSQIERQNYDASKAALAAERAGLRNRKPITRPEPDGGNR